MTPKKRNLILLIIVILWGAIFLLQSSMRSGST